ncbi:hypothetical protein [Crocosphaera sp. XPORK-15E]|uniref:hypothetical protein n=1 Tax=Crocosphaera sp. XPORK-15E TaxID=3110247 RepID=UPI002B1FF830|nr:hypothetical protein [Crocosphaera sp. XPORK-15E]MEA5537032.1 hypothetical protein [Crocosphaera sp. XPORK-15E]
MPKYPIIKDGTGMRKRGGSYNNNPRNCRSANRNNNNARNNNNGLRVVCGLPSTLLFESQLMGINWECPKESRPVPVVKSPKINQIGELSRVKPKRFPIYNIFDKRFSFCYNIDRNNSKFLLIIRKVNSMLQSVEGIYRKGKIELLETPSNLEESPVIITFLGDHSVKIAPQLMYFGMFTGGNQSTDEDFYLAEFRVNSDDKLDA